MGDETVLMTGSGQTRRRALGAFAGALAQPYLASAALIRVQASDPAIPANVFVDVDLATAEAAIRVGAFFKIVSSAGGTATVYERVASGSRELYREITAAAAASNAEGFGASLLGVQGGGTVQAQMLPDAEALDAIVAREGETARIVGGGGEWRFSSEDLSAEVAANRAGGIVRAASKDPTGASGAWVRRFPEEPRSSNFGVRHDDSYDNAQWFADISAFFAARGGGKLLWGEGLALSTAPLVMPDNLHIVGMGRQSGIRNTATGPSSNPKSPLYLGYWHPVFNGTRVTPGAQWARSIEMYACNAPVTGQATQVTMATEADAGAFTPGKIYYLRGRETRVQTIGGNQFELPLQNSLVKVLAADDRTGVIVFEKPVGFTSPTAPYLCAIRPGAGNAYGDAYFVQGVRVQNFAMFGEEGCAFGSNQTGAYDCHLRDIFGEIKNIVQVNAAAWCSFFGFRGRFKEVVAEVKFTAHNFDFGDFMATTSEAAHSRIGLFSFGEMARKIRGRGLTIDAPGRTGAPGILVQDCSDCSLVDLDLTMRDSISNAVQFTSHDSAASLRFGLDRFLIEHGGANSVTFLAGGKHEPKDAAITRGRFLSDSDSASPIAVAFRAGQGNRVSDIEFDKGNIVFAGAARGNRVLNLRIPKQPRPVEGERIARRNEVAGCIMFDEEEGTIEPIS